MCIYIFTCKYICIYGERGLTTVLWQALFQVFGIHQGIGQIKASTLVEFMLEEEKRELTISNTHDK
jgi:hypothetical protein